MTDSTFGDSTLQLSHDAVMKTVQNIPPLPPSVTRLNSLFADPDHKISDVVRTIELDPALCGRLLKMANSANYGPGTVGSVGEAVVRLGGGTVRSMAIAECLRPVVAMDLSTFGLTPETYWEHSAAVVCFAEELMAKRVADFGGDLPVAAVLHDFGKIVLATHLTADHIYFLSQHDPNLTASDTQRAIIGLDYAEVGAAVAQGWDLPERLVKAIQHHYQPELNDDVLCYGLGLAKQLTLRMEDKFRDQRDESVFGLAMDALQISEEVIAEVAEKGATRFESAKESFQ